MEQHPIPRQITTFEFKLIGFMTLRQFLYLVVFVPIGFIVFKLIPIPFINIFLGIIVALVGVAFAFFQIQDRPLDIWIKNFIKRMRSPTQYSYRKLNPPLTFLKSLYFDSDPHTVMAHVESQQKLAAYLAQKKQTQADSKRKSQIQSILKDTHAKPQLATSPTVHTQSSAQPSVPAGASSVGPPTIPDIVSSSPGITLKQPFFTGEIRNNRQIALPGVLVYVKDQQNNVLRLLKTNPHGIFATYSPLAVGEYLFEMKDPNAGYFFDTMKVKIESENPTPFKFYSKELL